MKPSNFTKSEKAELIDGARMAAAGPERDNFWNDLASYFDRVRQQAEDMVKPRPMKPVAQGS